MNRVELILGKVEPFAMDALNPIVRKREEQEPYQQYSAVNHRTPQKKVAGDFNAHLISSVGI
jgi:DNA polymerase III alpha subunit